MVSSVILKSTLFFNVILFATAGFFSSDDAEVDPDGYILFCPGMGGFDNQVEQFLGALSFAKGLKRTLVLPYWIEYQTTDSSSTQIPFEKYFQVEAITNFTKAITMDKFFNEGIANKIWPKGKRTVLCFTYRGDTQSCGAKEGNPYGPYWNKFKVNFDKDLKFAPLSYDMENEENRNEWLRKFSKEKFPVLAFTSTPGDFPILKHNLHVQSNLQWSNEIEKKANDFIKSFKKSADDKFLGIHIKNGIEHYRACEHAAEIKYDNFFSSAQCLGYGTEYGKMSQDLCYPSDHKILDQLEVVIEKVKPKYVFVVSEIHDILDRFKEIHTEVKFVRLGEKNVHVELAVLGKADHAIVNCVSVASAFVKRHRDEDGKTTEFWAFKKKDLEENRSEL